MTHDAVETIKSRLNIVDVVGTYVQLQKAGKNYKARSPFTNERTPSFFVSPEDGLYYCFSSGKGGDMFTFVQEMEGVDFKGALKVLADRAGIELVREDPRRKDERDKVLAALEESTRFFETQLRPQNKVIAYLKQRGLTGVTAKNFRIGYAPESWNALYDHLVTKGYTADIIEKAGLIVAKDSGGYYDRFRGRIMFPICDSMGRVVAFSGRVFHASGASEENTAKYVNSPETMVYDKSDVLYGLDKAKKAMRDTGECILVEGQMDLVMSHQAGLYNTVAVSGTALGTHHLQHIQRLANDLIFAFDADDAGVSAAGRGIDLSLSMGFDVRVVAVPSGKDPADSILEDPKRWEESVKQAEHVIDFFLGRIVSQEQEDHIKRRSIEVQVLPYIARLKRPIDQGYYVSKIADLLHMAEEPLWQHVKDLQQSVSTTLSSDEHEAKQNVDMKPFSRKEMLAEEGCAIISWQKSVEKPLIDVETYEKEFEDWRGESLAVEEVSAERRAKLLFTMQSSDEKMQQTYIYDVLAQYKKELLKDKITLEKKRLNKNTDETTEQEVLKNIWKFKKQMQELETE